MRTSTGCRPRRPVRTAAAAGPVCGCAATWSAPTDGFAQAPYIRESRRIKALTTVREQDISIKARGYDGPARFDASVGVGMYRIDLHPSTGGDNYIDVECAPFEIPLGALVPVATQNLLPAAKNIGTTHITNGAYRLHPVEWNIGESAGELAAFCLESGLSPQQIATDDTARRTFQARLVEAGVELHWPEIARLLAASPAEGPHHDHCKEAARRRSR